jgi:hypothetical protein
LFGLKRYPYFELIKVASPGGTAACVTF